MLVLVISFDCFQCLIPQMWVLAFAWKAMKNYINEWNTTALHFIIFCPLPHTKKCLINKLQSAILINTASSTLHLESHSSKGSLQWCLGWGHGPGEKKFSSHRQMIKLFFCFFFSVKYTLIYIVIFILSKSVIRNLILGGGSFFPMASGFLWRQQMLICKLFSCIH